ncbi:hypothetical protein [Tenacibaculum maritimum]|uniref:hypothetical protein n=1 Tax=Tenacibaculum maritimum TaxID=107401 RepID=UPI0012E51F5C|nr:hypothetical protein [Tenacibaculum maritimum]CAA0254907.1 conserved hypothetical protein [Tenacibaculum maritimum]
MSKVVIKPITEESLRVRKKVVYKDMQGNWIAVSELSLSEEKAFKNYKEAVLDRNVTPLPVATYNF